MPACLKLGAPGGFVQSSLVKIWALTCSLGALFFTERKAAPRWLAAYLVLLAASGFVQPFLPAVEPIPQRLMVPFLVVNVGTVSTKTFILLNSKIARQLKSGENVIADHAEALAGLALDMIRGRR